MKTETTHTPGPWYADFTRKPYGIFSVKPEGKEYSNANGKEMPLGHVFRSHVKGHNGQQEANARLIAAAPEMLDALKATWEFWCGGDAPKEIENMIVSAIAKAEWRDK